MAIAVPRSRSRSYLNTTPSTSLSSLASPRGAGPAYCCWVLEATEISISRLRGTKNGVRHQFWHAGIWWKRAVDQYVSFWLEGLYKKSTIEVEIGKFLYKSRHGLFHIVHCVSRRQDRIFHFSWKFFALVNTVNLQEKKTEFKKGWWLNPTSSNALEMKSDHLYSDVKGESIHWPLLQTKPFPYGF